MRTFTTTLFALLFIAFSIQLSAQGARRTGFNPKQYGFKFSNSFKNNVVTEIDWKTGGLCGGMVYTSLDYFYQRRGMPKQDFRPQDGTRLHTHIYNRQVHSLVTGENKVNWIAFVASNWGGMHNTKFFNLGLNMRGDGQLQHIKRSIDQGRPIPIGLKGAGGPNDGGDHQVLVIGYDFGRYKGDLKSYKGELKLYVYDPNYPNRQLTLIPDVGRQIYKYKEFSAKDTPHWRAYFADREYKRRTPPTFSNPVYRKDGNVHALVLEFNSGADDLRGGRDNVDITINFYAGASQTIRNANLSRRWLENYSQYVYVKLNKPINEKLIKNISIYKHASGGASGDNWDLNFLKVRALGHNIDKILVKSATRLYRFKGDADRKRTTVVVNRAAPQFGSWTRPSSNSTKLVRYLEFRIQTGSDDLRGGNDNLNVFTHFSDRKRQVNTNVNKSQKWRNNQYSTVRVKLNKPRPLNQINRIVLSLSTKPGFGSDDWNMNYIQVKADFGGGQKKTLHTKRGNPVKRFKSDSRNYTVQVYH